MTDRAENPSPGREPLEPRAAPGGSRPGDSLMTRIYLNPVAGRKVRLTSRAQNTDVRDLAGGDGPACLLISSIPADTLMADALR